MSASGSRPGATVFSDAVVGVDGGYGGRDAIALARELVAQPGRLTLVHARAGGLFPPTAADVAFEAESDAPEYAASRSLLERERDAAQIEADIADTVADTAARGLHEFAEREGADLLVVGSSHRGVVGRVLLGDDTRAALNGAPCAVAIAPSAYARGHAHTGLSVIGVGYDGSQEGRAALACARRLADSHGASVRAMEVVTIPTWLPAGAVGPGWTDVLEAKVAARRREVSSLPGLEGDAVLGVPGEELAVFGRQVDLLVVGSRAYGPPCRLMLGNTANYLVGHARCPLLVLPSSGSGG